MTLSERITEHLSGLSPADGDTDTAWLLRECKKHLDDLYEGRLAILPKTRDHAEKLFVVADAMINPENYKEARNDLS